MSDDLHYPIQEPAPAARYPLPALIRPAHLVHKPSPFRDDRAIHEVPAGATIAEMIAGAGIVMPPAHFDVVAAVDGRLVERHLWAQVRPGVGQNVVLMTRLAGGGDGGGAGKSALMIVASLAIVAGAVATGGALGPALGGALGITAAAGTSIATGVFMSAGFLALNSLVKPPSRGTMVQPGPSYSVTGVQNQANRYGVIPFVAGKMKLYPTLGGEPYTMVRGGEQWMAALLIVGYGPLNITNVRIGDTPIEDFHANDLKIEILEGYPTDPDPKHYPEQVIEDTPGATVGMRSENHYIGTIGGEVDEIEVDLWFPEGLWRMADHEQQSNHIIYVIEYRLVGESNWQLLHRNNLQTRKLKPFRKTHDKEVPRGEYQVRVRKEKATNDVRYHETMIVTSVKGFKNARPVKMDNLAMISFRIKADENMNGVIDEVSCEAISVLPDYEKSNGTWIERPTRNPASIFRAVLQHRATHRKIGDKKIAFGNAEHGLDAWHEYCQDEGWTYDAVWDQDATAYERLTSVAFAGRASYTRWNGKHGIVREKPQNVPIQHISQANSWNNTGNLNFMPVVKALKVEFINRDNDYAREERLVFAEPYSKADPPPREQWDTLDLTESGITKKDDAWRHGRFFLAQAEFRREVFACRMDLENLVATRGDMVRYQNENALIGIASGTVVAADANTVTVDQHLVLVAGNNYEIRFRLRNGDSVIRSVQTGSGSSGRILQFSGSGTVPDPGDLYMFGLLNEESTRCVITEIRHAGGMHADLKLMVYHPGLHTADTGPIPIYDPIVTEPRPPERRKLGKPKIIDVKKVSAANPDRPDTLDRLRLRVSIQPPAERKKPPETYRYRLRQKGEDDWADAVKDDKPARSSHEFNTKLIEYGDKYELQVRAQTEKKVSAWSDVVEVDCRRARDRDRDPGGGGGERGDDEEAPDRTRYKYAVKIRGLQLVDKPNSDKFTGGGARFTWKRRAVNAPQAVGRAAAGRGDQAGNFKHYKVQIRDPALGGRVRREETTKDETYDYTRNENTQDSERIEGRADAPPIREFTIRVIPINKAGDRGEHQELTVKNPAPPAPANLVVGGAFGQLTFSMDAPTDADYDDTRVWASSTSPVALTRENLVSKGRVLSGSVAVTPGVRYFVRAAHSDLFSKDVDTLNLSPEVAADSLTIDAEGTARFGFSPPPLFTGSESPNRITWTSFTAHVLFLGSRVNKVVSSGSLNWPGAVTYMYYVNGETVVRSSTDILDAVGIDRAILAVWKGQQKIKQEGGDALIDGRDIYAGTITAQQLVAGQLITESAQIKDAIITNAHINELAADKITANSIFGQTLYIGEDRVIINGPQRRITVLDTAGRVRTRLGKIPDGAGGTTFGLAIYDSSEKLIFGPFADPTDPGDRFDGIYIKQLTVDSKQVKNKAISDNIADSRSDVEIYNLLNPADGATRQDTIHAMPTTIYVDVDTGQGAFIHGLTKFQFKGDARVEGCTFDHILHRGIGLSGTELLRTRMHFDSFIFKLPSTNPMDYVAYVPFSYHDKPGTSGPKNYFIRFDTTIGPPPQGKTGNQVRCVLSWSQIMITSLRK